MFHIARSKMDAVLQLSRQDVQWKLEIQQRQQTRNHTLLNFGCQGLGVTKGVNVLSIAFSVDLVEDLVWKHVSEIE